MICPRCGSRLDNGAAECQGCGMPTTFMEHREVIATGGPVIEPEVLESLEAAERMRSAPPVGNLGCAIGPGCGCIGLPLAVLAVLAGVLVSSAVALLWVLSLGRVPASIIRMARQMRRGSPQA